VLGQERGTEEAPDEVGTDDAWPFSANRSQNLDHGGTEEYPGTMAVGMTRARKMILEALSEAEVPLSAAEIHERLPLAVDLATVYRSLHYL